MPKLIGSLNYVLRAISLENLRNANKQENDIDSLQVGTPLLTDRY